MTVTDKQPAVTDPADHPNSTGSPGRSAPRKDLRIVALTRFAISISVLTVAGHAFLGFEQAPITPLMCLAVSYLSAILFELVDSWAWRRPPEFRLEPASIATFLLPAHITALACAMLLYSNAELWPFVFATVAGNASKYVFRVRIKGRLKHVLNPSNTGIAATLLIFHWVGIAQPYQFVNNFHGVIPWALPAAILLLGTMLNAKLTRKMPLIFGWLAGFLIQAVLRWLLHGDSLLGALMPLTGVAFVLFTNYMITDPGSTPIAARSQQAFGLATGLIYGALVWNGVVFGLFFALVITCLLRGFGLVALGLYRSRLRRPTDRSAELGPLARVRVPQ